MYRNTASLAGGNMTVGVQPPPRKSSSDSDLEVSELLVRKRQEIDLEIKEFKAAKEKEFQDFERSLRRQRQRRKREKNIQKDGASDSRPGALSLLALPSKNGRSNGHADPSQTDADATPRPTAPLGRPTTGVEKLSIKGETLAPAFSVGSPPSPASPSTSLKPASRRPPTPGEPSGKQRFFTPPDKQPPTPPTPANEMHDAFAGVFTPAYLPLLDSRSNTTDDTTVRHGSISLPGSASDSISPMMRSYRARTEPAIPSTSLPSALRTASGTTVRKRKHVTFQLADSAIVEPSSSYEEMPSPSPRDAEHVNSMIEDGIDELLGVPAAAHAEDDVPEPTRGLALAVPSPTLRGRDRQSREIPGDLTEAVENGMGVGFFELDEELNSPAIDAEKPFIDDFEEESSPVGSRKGDALDEKDERTLLTYEYGGSVPIDIVRPSSSWVGTFGH